MSDRKLSHGAGAPALAPMARADGASPLLEVTGLKKYFPIRRGLLQRAHGAVHAVDGVTFSVQPGETLSLVGESGCGKSTVGRTVLRLLEPTAGVIRLNGQDISRLGKRALRPLRQQMQIIFQDPGASLDPRKTAGASVAEPLEVHGIGTARERRDKVAALFDSVGLRAAQMHSYPHQFSGGQRQRICIARALALGPQLIVGDEPVSALDVSIQAQVINLMMDLQARHGLSYLFISHNLSVVEHMSHRVAVMYLGRIVEIAPKPVLFAAPRHPYTQALLAAAPVPDPKVRRRRIPLEGDVPSPINPPSGCHFHTRCPMAVERCRVEAPVLRESGSGHFAACHLA